VVQEGKGLAGHLGFDPQSYLAQLHGQGVLVHPVDAVGDDVPNGLPLGLRRRFLLPGPDSGELPAQAAGGRKQEVARAAGGVEDADGEESVFGE